MPSFIRENYAQLLAYREEGLRKVGARFVDDLEKPKSRCFYPTVWSGRRESPLPAVALGPWRVSAVGPSMVLGFEELERRGLRQAAVLDIGSAKGTFRDYIALRDPRMELTYAGVDVARFAVDFPVYASVAEVKGRFDLIFMSEVVEHMSADDFVQEYLQEFPRLLVPDGSLLVSTPNPLAPGVLDRDVTHCQHYPWFDLYALLRFYFAEVDVVRTRFIHTPRRLFLQPIRRVLSYLLEIDWCEGITLTARRPLKK